MGGAEGLGIVLFAAPYCHVVGCGEGIAACGVELLKLLGQCVGLIEGYLHCGAVVESEVGETGRSEECRHVLFGADGVGEAFELAHVGQLVLQFVAGESLVCAEACKGGVVIVGKRVLDSLHVLVDVRHSVLKTVEIVFVPAVVIASSECEDGGSGYKQGFGNILFHLSSRIEN